MVTRLLILAQIPLALATGIYRLARARLRALLCVVLALSFPAHAAPKKKRDETEQKRRDEEKRARWEYCLDECENGGTRDHQTGACICNPNPRG